MEKRAENAISEYNRKIEALQAKRDALIKKEKERKAKAQEKWKGIFSKELMIHVQKVFGEDYEEDVLPEAFGGMLGASLSAFLNEQSIRPAGEKLENKKALVKSEDQGRLS